MKLAKFFASWQKEIKDKETKDTYQIIYGDESMWPREFFDDFLILDLDRISTVNTTGEDFIIVDVDGGERYRIRLTLEQFEKVLEESRILVLDYTHLTEKKDDGSV